MGGVDELVSYNLWSGGSPHAIVTGRPGSGKSGFLNDLAADCLRDNQTRVVILDRYHGFDSLVTLSTDGRRWDSRAAMFDPCVGSENQVVGFLPEFIDLIQSKRGQKPLTADERSLLITAIRTTFQQCRLSAQNTPAIALSTLVDTMDTSTVAGEALSDYLASRVALSDEKGTMVREAASSQLSAFTAETRSELLNMTAAACLLQAIARDLDNTQTWTRTVLIIDDAWMFLSDTIVSAMILRLVRQSHAQRLAVVCCTTVLSDFLQTVTGSEILRSAGHRFLFRQQESDAATMLALTDEQAQLLQSVTTIPGQYAEALYQRMPDGESQVMQVVYDAHFRWVVTQNAREKHRRRHLEQEFRLRGLTPRDAMIAAVDFCVQEEGLFPQVTQPS